MKTAVLDKLGDKKPANFEPLYILVVHWDGVTPPGNAYRKQTTSFQAFLVSDGKKTMAGFLYQPAANLWRKTNARKIFAGVSDGGNDDNAVKSVPGSLTKAATMVDEEKGNVGGGKL